MIVIMRNYSPRVSRAHDDDAGHLELMSQKQTTLEKDIFETVRLKCGPIVMMKWLRKLT